jgi:hypothetical protein
MGQFAVSNGTVAINVGGTTGNNPDMPNNQQ